MRQERAEIESITAALHLLDVSQRQVAANCSVSQSVISRFANKPWGEVQYSKVVTILETAAEQSNIHGRFEIKPTAKGTVKSVFFVYRT